MCVMSGSTVQGWASNEQRREYFAPLFMVSLRHRPGCYGLVVPPTVPDTGMVWKSTLSMMDRVGVNFT